VGGWGLETTICESRMWGAGWGVGEGLAGNEDEIMRPASMAPTVDALSVHMASLGETWYESLVRFPMQRYQICHRQSRNRADDAIQ
jgi:hypothetical protein